MARGMSFCSLSARLGVSGRLCKRSQAPCLLLHYGSCSTKRFNRFGRVALDLTPLGFRAREVCCRAPRQQHKSRETFRQWNFHNYVIRVETQSRRRHVLKARWSTTVLAPSISMKSLLGSRQTGQITPLKGCGSSRHDVMDTSKPAKRCDKLSRVCAGSRAAQVQLG